MSDWGRNLQINEDILEFFSAGKADRGDPISWLPGAASQGFEVLDSNGRHHAIGTADGGGWLAGNGPNRGLLWWSGGEPTGSAEAFAFCEWKGWEAVLKHAPLNGYMGLPKGALLGGFDLLSKVFEKVVVGLEEVNRTAQILPEGFAQVGAEVGYYGTADSVAGDGLVKVAFVDAPRLSTLQEVASELPGGEVEQGAEDEEVSDLALSAKGCQA